MLKHLLYVLTLSTLWLCFASCEKEAMSERELLAFVQKDENGLEKNRKSGNASIDLTYRPTDLLVAQELSIADRENDSIINQLRNKYDKYFYFVLSISVDEDEILSSNMWHSGQFGEMVQKLAFRMGDYIQLHTSEQKSIPLADYVYPRMYGLSKSTDMLLVFPKEEIQEAEWIKITLKDFGLDIGNTHFKYNMDNLISCPKIDFRQL